MGFSIAHIVLSASTVRNDYPEYSSPNIFHHALLKSHYLALVFIIYALGGLLFVGSLGGFHCFLISTAHTTNERIKKSYKKKNPFHRGVFGNFVQVLFPPQYP
eukprot:gene17533-20923_t